MPYVWVDIRVEGEWPSPEDLAAHEAITSELDKLNFGEFSGAGVGQDRGGILTKS